jgi:hypothetical protein
MFDDIIKKPIIDEAEAKFTKDYEKWMEDYQKLFKKQFQKDIKRAADVQPIIYTPYIPLVVYEYPITKPAEFIVLNFVITKTGVSFTDV